MFSKFKNQIWFILILFSIAFTVVSISNIYYIKKTEQTISYYVNETHKTHKVLLNDLLLIHEFLIYDSFSEEFRSTQNSDRMNQHYQNMRELKHGINNLLHADSSYLPNTLHISTLIKDYNDSFFYIVYQISKNQHYSVDSIQNIMLKSELATKNDRVRDAFNELLVQLEREKETNYSNVEVYTYFLISAFFLLSMFIAYRLSRRVSYRITNLNRFLKKFIDTDFSDEVYLSTDSHNNEISELLRNVNVLKIQTVNLIHHFKEQVNQRTLEISEKNAALESSNLEISAQNEKILNANLLLNENQIILLQKNKYIIDSINYAQRIQSALLSAYNDFQSVNLNGFILYRPKDILSGDFYRIKRLSWPGVNKVLVTVADCTGHGVAGSLLSMLGMSYLEEITDKYVNSSPAFILDKLSAQIKKNLYDNQRKSVQDTMDMGLCIIDLNNFTLDYAGARRPLYIFNNGAFQELKGNSFALGFSISDDFEYTNHHIKLTAHHKFYMSSDGYADQFGGDRNRKFLNKNLKNTLSIIQEFEFNEQATIIEKVLDGWKGNREQVDDITLMGFELQPNSWKILSNTSNLQKLYKYTNTDMV